VSTPVPTVILACGARKDRHPAPAFRLYRGRTYSATLRWARSVTTVDHAFILSARYGLIPCQRVIAPYEAQMGTASQVVTVEQVRQQAADLGLAGTRPVFAGGGAYLTLLRAAIPGVVGVVDYLEPGRRGIGHQLQWYARNLGRLPGAA